MTSYITDHCAWFERCRDNRLLLLHAPPATPLGAGQYLEACHCTSLAPVQKPVFAPGLTSPINSPIARRPSAEGYTETAPRRYHDRAGDPVARLEGYEKFIHMRPLSSRRRLIFT